MTFAISDRSIRKLLRFSAMTECSDAQRYGLTAENRFPAAKLTQLAANIPVASSGRLFYRLDPVTLTADRDSVTLSPFRKGDLSRSEAESLVDALNEFFGEDGLRIMIASDHEWLLQSLQPLELQTTPLYQVQQRQLQSQWFAQGNSKKWWQQRLAEMEMLLFQHPLNQQRIRQRQPIVSSLWLWGEGELLQNSRSSWNGICGEDLALQGLAAWSKSTIFSPVKQLSELSFSNRDILVSLDDISWRDFQKLWLQPALRCLRLLQCRKVQIVTSDNRVLQLDFVGGWLL